ncbi:serine/threonine-protein kinase [Kibdelosporangium banguiense]|uniref:non-specific serine/threonine protein kinase n=1 Tax=Kibdelosporangium banguiense TaxID=1365924 RepID=A0ABS4TPN4_9PSEU|nr:serine/threonine-protein kinase [Kibdelosporangium banguiense]MBP2325898.1 serine/threonine-protein kinase [Kibdelosporangium banguiense]
MAWLFGPYRMEGLIARGGMGEVHRAHDTRHDRVVALKVLSDDLAGDAEFRERFKREAHAAARLREPHVIPIHAYGEIEGRLYLDMRLVEGAHLGKIIKDGGPMSQAAAVDIISQVASALDAAHAEQLVHRDVKPSNVLISPNGFAYLVDFGIARTIAPASEITATGDTVGTLHYMAPERFGTGAVDHRVDVYSLACMLYECLTGLKPFRAENPLAVMFGHVNNAPPRPGEYAPELAKFDRVIAKGMAKNPADRFAGAGELAAAAKQAMKGESSTKRMPVVLPSAPAPKKTGRKWIAVVVAAAVLGLGALLWSQFGHSKQEPSGQPAPTTATQTSAPVKPAADLGVAKPISSPACDGKFIVIVGSAVNKANYAADVAKFLLDNPGADYLHAVSTKCSSLRAQYNGVDIYAAFYGPYADQKSACDKKTAVGKGSFVRRLDNSTSPEEVVRCL